METKLTLRLDKFTIKKAKHYANDHNISLSKMVESYLESVTTKKMKKDKKITPLVESLSGVIKLDKKSDYKKDYSRYLAEKYK